MMTRTLLLDVEARIGTSLPLDGPAGTWLIRHAVDLHNKRQLGHDRRTPYQKARGRSYTGELFRWGTSVLYRLSGEVHGGVMAARWRPGIWLGKTWTSDEHLIGTESGAVVLAKCQAFGHGPHADGAEPGHHSSS